MQTVIDRAERAEERITETAEKLLAERRGKVTAYLAANIEGLRQLAWRVTRDAGLAEQAVAQTALELWAGRTREAVCYRALKMNARNLLEKRATNRRREESLEACVSEPSAKSNGADEYSTDAGEAVDFPSPRLEDQDPLDILIARQEQAETNDELEYAVRNVRRRGNRWILQTEWWKGSALSALAKGLGGSDFGGSPE